ncbi:hypothetical protein RFI_06393 [Reticulomyxa filosa]|uniref:peptidylprolyl isomerase n=1 Tax=Reticulomyxa filosa TaxID=46433 RepID=X6NXK7_RETFI|nr:hypothetical protein RFI_06393 [Reticulomyxa filosa]|eukprot:ETO30731.1 hypothetical protein RFI_06393 [Reticulomyxa filosa]
MFGTFFKRPNENEYLKNSVHTLLKTKDLKSSHNNFEKYYLGHITNKKIIFEYALMLARFIFSLFFNAALLFFVLLFLSCCRYDRICRTTANTLHFHTEMANDNESVVPIWARDPKLENCGLIVKKGDTVIEKLGIILKKNVCISRRHAIITHGESGNVYLLDLGSSHGTFKNGKKLEAKKREALADMDVIKFGASTREYIVRLDLDQPMTTDLNSKKDTSERASASDVKDKITGHKRSLIESQKTDDNDEAQYSGKANDNITPNKPKKVMEGTKIVHKCHDSKEEALVKAEKLRQDILKQASSSGQDDSTGEVFKDFAKRESDCNSYKRGGDLGLFGLGKMQKPFEEAAFSLQIGELSQPVETASGVHLILRTQ